ncbi:MAG: flagellar FliJ family protein [Candidatus Saganbacteria bacterium]|nr:flagellar FliJ family protein [Candidatus Saganbacteria bacterium]
MAKEVKPGKRFIERQREQRRDELRTIMKRGPISDFAKVMRRKAHLGKLREDLDVQIEKVVEASQKLEEQRAHLIESMKEKKIIEKHKGQRFDEYKKAMEKIEMKFMDEIATQRFKHEKKED